MSRNLSAKALSSRLESLRQRGRVSLLAALGAPQAPEPEALPRLMGAALAKHHLAIALEACREVGSSKPQTFAKLRLLVNQLEQGRIPKLTTVAVPSVKDLPPQRQSRFEPTSRRQWLLSRAFQSANQIAEWRKGASESAAEMR